MYSSIIIDEKQTCPCHVVPSCCDPVVPLAYLHMRLQQLQCDFGSKLINGNAAKGMSALRVPTLSLLQPSVQLSCVTCLIGACLLCLLPAVVMKLVQVPAS